MDTKEAVSSLNNQPNFIESSRFGAVSTSIDSETSSHKMHAFYSPPPSKITSTNNSPKPNKAGMYLSSHTQSPSSLYSANDIDYESPKLLMNYSPKHSRKPSSLTSNRNINMKNLSLNLDDNSSVTSLNTERKRSLTISIPNHSSSDINLSSINPSSPFVTTDPLINAYQLLPIKKTKPHLSTTHHLVQPDSPTVQSLQTSKDFKFPDSPLANDFQKIQLNRDQHRKVPEELQELSQLDAYPNGPANVLNGSIFLYSEPNAIDINEYDLVINVAKECKDLSSVFNPEKNPNKKYIHIPWNHTSSISRELPKLTQLISTYDDLDITDPNTKKRKILVHCQCGVSRSACVVVAYFMHKLKLNVNDAYELLKTGTGPNSPEEVNKLMYSKGYKIQSCNRICPNMSLIFELMDFNDILNNVK